MVLCIMGSDYKYHIFIEKLNIEKNSKTEDEIIREVNSLYVKILTDKIKNKEFKFFDKGDNGRIYSINGEDKLSKYFNFR